MFVQIETTLSKSDVFPNVTSRTLPEFKPITDEQIAKASQIVKEMSKVRHGRVLNSEALRPNSVLLETPDSEQNSPLEDRKDEKCSQGGTCEFFFYCWMVGGLLDGTCGGLLKGCCHRVAKAGILGVQDSNSIDYGNEGLSYGPVINDESK
jgi:hypothetical protein